MTQETLKTLYEAKDFPVFQNRMYPSPEAARNCPKGDIRLVEDQLTGLIYNAAFRSELVEYDIHYQNEQAVSPLFRQHLEQVATIVEGTLGREQLIEVGCGKAYFLQLLVDKGFDITGFDPTYEGDSPRVRKDYFREGAGLRAKGLILRHVLEHIADPVGFLGLLKAANGGQGKIYIEVPCFDWICKHRAWFDIFYEHANYFRLSDFKRMFRHIERFGSLFGDQYLYVVADLASLQTPTYDPSDAVDFPADFLSRLILAEQSRAEQSRAEQSRAEQSRAEQSRAEQSRAEHQYASGAEHPKESSLHCSEKEPAIPYRRSSTSTLRNKVNTLLGRALRCSPPRLRCRCCHPVRPSL